MTGIDHIAYLSLHTCPLSLPGTGDAGGMNVTVHGQAMAMAARGVRVDVYTRRGDPIVDDVVEVVPGYRVIHVTAGPAEAVAIADQVPLVPEFAAGVLRHAEALGADYRLAHAHYWLSGRAGLTVADAWGVPLANSFHTLGRVKDMERSPRESPSSLERIASEEEVIARSACVIASTPDEARDLLDHYGADPTRLCVTPPGVDLDVFVPGDRDRARRRLGLGPGPLILAAGRLQPLKGFDVTLEALALLRGELPVELVVVGGPSGDTGSEELDRLRGRASRPDLAGAVTFRPAVAHHDLADYMRAADVVHVPSRSESFGLVAVEAQACGIPVVTSDVGGLRHSVRDGGSGLRVAGFDPVDHAEALGRILTDPDLAKQLGEGGVDHAAQYGREATTDRLLELYKGITG